MKLQWKTKTAGEQRGAFIVFTALALWFLMMFIAFSVDFGNYYQHRSRLQNAADAAALAGVAEYTTEEIAKSTGAVNAPALSKGRLLTPVEGGNDAPDGVKSRAKEYVKNNYGEIEIKDNKVWSEEVTEEKTENGVTQNVTTTHRYCRVDLEDTVQTFFARIFGVDSLTVKVSALAMMDGSAEHETWGQRLQGIAKQLELIAPNQLWESLKNENKTRAFEIRDLNNPKQSSTGNIGFGEGKNRYYVVTGTSPSLLGAEDIRQDHSDKNGVIIGYKEPRNGGICADPIYADPGITWQDLLDNDDKLPKSGDRRCCPTTKIFTIANNDGVTRTSKGEIVALYLNRDHITNTNNIPNTNIKRTGLSDRFTKINVDKITGTVRTGNPKKHAYALYARLESETVRTGKQALMPVHGVSIVVNTTRGALGMHEEKGEIKFSEDIRPLVIAYDGPDPYRGKLLPGKDDVEDAPWIATRYTDLNKSCSIVPNDPIKDLFNDTREREYYPSEIRYYFEPLLTNDKYLYKNASTKNTNLENWGLVKSALTTSGPIEVFIGDGCVFYGAIYAPNSKVILTIKGTGYIYGFIAARQIVPGPDSDWNPNLIHDTETVSMPTLAVSGIRWDNNNMIVDYDRTYVETTYQIAFNYYEDFTKAEYYPVGIK